jgi:hypothetical protein
MKRLGQDAEVDGRPFGGVIEILSLSSDLLLAQPRDL